MFNSAIFTALQHRTVVWSDVGIATQFIFWHYCKDFPLNLIISKTPPVLSNLQPEFILENTYANCQLPS